MLRRFVAVGAALILGAGCRSLSDGSGWQSLPPAPPGAMNFSDYQPEHPYEPSGEGVAERSVFTAPGGPGYSVEVRDFLISPRNPEAPLTLFGAAVFEVRQGSGEATVGKEKITLLPGTVFTVSTGESLHVTASNEPLALRTWIVWPGRKR
jgi:hypothetical protein